MGQHFNSHQPSEKVIRCDEMLKQYIPCYVVDNINKLIIIYLAFFRLSEVGVFFFFFFGQPLNQIVFLLSVTMVLVGVTSPYILRYSTFTEK